MRKLIQAFLLWIILVVLKGGDNMPIAVIYVALIMSGDKTYVQVPKHVQPEVKRQLELLGYGELAE